MPRTENFYKMALGWTDDEKISSLARFGAEDAIMARDLFSQMIRYSRRNLTDGFCPPDAVGMLMYPLPVDHAMRLAMHLADRGAYGPLIESHANRVGWQVVNYPKWNDTRAEVQARKASGRKAALHRWNGLDADGNAGSNADGNAERIQSKSKSKDHVSPITGPRTSPKAGPDRTRARGHPAPDSAADDSPPW